MTADQVRRRATDTAALETRRAIGVAVILVVSIGQTVITVVLRARPLAPWEWAGVAYLVTFAVTLLGSRLRQTPATLGDGRARVRPRVSRPARQELDAIASYAGVSGAVARARLLGHSAFIAPGIRRRRSGRLR